MLGKKLPMNPIESRKRLLVAESEFNRAQLAQEWVAVTNDVRALTDRVKSVGAIASAAALLVAGIMAFRRVKSGRGRAKPSWLRTILKGAVLVSTLWPALHPPGRKQ